MAKIQVIIRKTQLAVSQPRYQLVIRPAATIVQGGGATALADLTDVDLTDLQVGDVPKWDGAKFVNAPDEAGGGGGPIAIEDVGGLQDALDAKQDSLGFTPEDVAAKGGAGGYAPLDGDALVPQANIPFLDVEKLGEWASGRLVGRISPGNGPLQSLTLSQSYSILNLTPSFAAKEDKELKGVPEGYASLDETGRVPASQLPAFVDDVEEYADFASLPVTGEAGKIYTTLDTNKVYRWATTVYVEIVASPGSTDDVTEGATNLYFTAGRVRATELTGYSAEATRVALDTGDTVLAAFKKLGKWVADLGSAAFAAASAAGLAMLTAADVAAQTALLNSFTTTLKGLVPPPGSATGKFLKDDGTWAAPGGGGTPGGATDDIQINSAGVFAGASDFKNEGGQLRLPSIATPSVPAAGGIKVFAKDYGNSPWPHFLAPEGVVPWPVQPYIGDGRFYAWLPIVGGTTASLIGWPAQSVNGTSTTAAIGAGNRRTNAQRMEFLIGSASPSACAHFRIAQAGFGVNGSSSWEGGFRGLMHGAPATGCTNSSHRFFMGLGDSLSMSDVDPSTQTQVVGIGYDASDANLQFMHNDGSGTCTKIDLGSSFAKPTTDRSVWYRMRLYAPPGTTRILYYEVTNLETGAVAVGAVTTNLPLASSYVTPKAYGSVGGVSSVVGITMGNIVFITEPQ